MSRNKRRSCYDIDDNAEEIYTMDMPCECSCGKWFDLNDGNSCDSCNQVFCTDCVKEPFELCTICEA